MQGSPQLFHFTVRLRFAQISRLCLILIPPPFSGGVFDHYLFGMDPFGASVDVAFVCALT